MVLLFVAVRQHLVLTTIRDPEVLGMKAQLPRPENPFEPLGIHIIELEHLIVPNQPIMLKFVLPNSDLGARGRES